MVGHQHILSDGNGSSAARAAVGGQNLSAFAQLQNRLDMRNHAATPSYRNTCSFSERPVASA